MREPVIDVCEVVYDTECWTAYLRALATAAPRYLILFAGRLATLTGRDPGAVAAEAARDATGTADQLAAVLGRGFDIDHHVAALAETGVAHQVLHGGPWPIGDGTVNDRVASYAARHPDLLSAWAGVSFADPRAAISEARRALDDLGATGLSVIPFLDGVDPSGPEHAGFWRLAADRGVPVWLHCGQHFRSDVPIDVSAPRVLDRIAGAHPGLVLVAGHGGWPWVTEMLAVAQRHADVYLEFSSHRPARMGVPGSGWEALLALGTTSVRTRVLFGSTSWTQARPPAALADEVTRLGLPDDVVRAWLHDNARRLLGSAS
ncbi:amidohydrolase family protein [Nonomuraea ferruginea]|uniref:Amidohydrolase family protein n=1 Tax=Nonomuraea ferruginea TaxID=46174 RepID=A0ABT4SVC0_9ACTN|nr:amidohydrolase family protein [Nonomuraea ferruginea]MDA0641206.1 amidohydrolase family protein [Nonomuraea ferruginea]